MKLYLTGGGTGGHVTPGLAIARYFIKHHPNSEARFAGTAKGIEADLVPRAGYALDTVEIVGLRRKLTPQNIAYNMKAGYLALASVGQAKKLLRAYQPDCVIGCGGYASFPVVRAAQELKIPTVLLEVNAYPGVTTKMLAKKADQVLICFEQSRALLGGGNNIMLTGAPVRDELLMADRQSARAKLGLMPDEKLVVSFWGSMGAKYMNQNMAEYFALAAKQGVKYRHVHATGNAAQVWMPQQVRDKGCNLAGSPNLVLTPYIYDMATYMAAADLVLCRAGAASIGELCALGKPSILVPSPFVAENHQEKNARVLEEAGAAQVLLEKDSTGQAIFDAINALIADDTTLESMRKAAFSQAKITASADIDTAICACIKS